LKRQASVADGKRENAQAHHERTADEPAPKGAEHVDAAPGFLHGLFLAELVEEPEDQVENGDENDDAAEKGHVQGVSPFAAAIIRVRERGVNAAGRERVDGSGER